MEALALRINPADGDLDVDPATGKPRMVFGAEEVAQSLKRRLELWQGEFFWSPKDGVPWDRFLGKAHLGEMHLHILAELQRDKRLKQIVDLRVAGYDERTRTLTIVFAGLFADELVRAVWEVPVGGVRGE